MENIMEVPQIIKNRPTIWANNSISSFYAALFLETYLECCGKWGQERSRPYTQDQLSLHEPGPFD